MRSKTVSTSKCRAPYRTGHAPATSQGKPRLSPAFSESASSLASARRPGATRQHRQQKKRSHQHQTVGFDSLRPTPVRCKPAIHASVSSSGDRRSPQNAPEPSFIASWPASLMSYPYAPLLLSPTA